MTTLLMLLAALAAANAGLAAFGFATGHPARGSFNLGVALFVGASFIVGVAR